MILTVTMNPAIDKIYFIDDYQLGKVHRPSGMIASAGGKGLNVARVAKLMCEVVGAIGPLGGGNGVYIEKKIKELGIIPYFTAVEGETRICINVTDGVNQHFTEVLENGPVITQEEALAFLEKFECTLGVTDIVTISGSLPQGLPEDFYARLILIAKVHGKKVLLDTSGIAFVHGVKALPYLIKPNEEEIKAVYEGPVESLEDKIQVIKHFKNLGIVLPIISMGKDGSLAGLCDGIYKVSIPPVKVVNSVGSGDAFVAGCAVALQRSYSEMDLLKMATACGTANTQYEHTGYVEPQVVDEYFKRVIVEMVSNY